MQTQLSVQMVVKGRLEVDCLNLRLSKDAQALRSSANWGSWCSWSVSVHLELPVAIVEWANLASLEPTGDAVKVEGMVADAPGDGTLVRGDGQRRIGLTLDAQVHYVITADGTVVDGYVPGPQRYGGPLLHDEAFWSIGDG